MSDSDFDIQPEVPAATLADVQAAAEALANKQAEVDAIDAKLKAANAELHHLRTRLVPDMFTAAGGLQSLRLRDGREVVVEDVVSGSLPKEPNRRAAAVRELEAMGGGALVKRRVSVDFPRGDNRLGQAREALAAAGFTADEAHDVHPQTLAAFVREMLRQGRAVDADALGVYVGRTTKVKAPRGGKE